MCNNKITNTIQQIDLLIQKESLPHAIMIEGSNPEKNVQLINHIACAILCSDTLLKPCGKCQHCYKVQSLTHPDLDIVKTSGISSLFSVDTIRKIRETAFVLPNDSEYKVYVFNNADNMSISAQNALLKILEEPPKRVKFLLSAKSSESFLDTIKSRLFIFNLHSESYLDNPEVTSISNSLLDSLVSTREYDTLKLTPSLIKNKHLFKNVILTMIEELRNVYINFYSNQKKDFKLSNYLTVKQSIDIIQELNASIILLDNNVNNTLIVTNLFSKIRKIVYS